ncbi:MAG: AsmA-like C-terminal region-containing protein [Chitinophagales bacterium]|nr:hypothetical protein [Chitinophagales bacterium]MDW8393287.1 AsmA-like C-terminal region-containing protein [Chitinophagales bacterium]
MIKKILLVLGIVLLLLLAAAATVPLLFREQLTAQVKAAVNESLEAKVDFGSVSLSLIRRFPQLSLCIGDLSIAGKEVFEGDTLLQADELRLTLSLFDVLQGDRIGIRSAEVINPNVYIHILTDGRANYNITKEDTSAAAGSQAAYRVELQSYRISNGRVVYDDKSTGTFLRLEKVDHSGKGDFTQSVFSLVTKSQVGSLQFRYGGVSYLNRAQLKADATLRMNLDSALYTFEKNEFVLNDLPLSLDGWLAMPEEDIRMDLRWALGRSDFRHLLSLVPGMYTADFARVKASGTVSASGRVWGTYGEQQNPAFEVSLKVENGQAQYPDLPQAIRNVQVDLRLSNPDGDPDRTMIDLRQLHAELGSDAVDARMLVSTPVSDPNINGMVKGVINLGNLKNLVPLPAGTELSGVVRSDVTLKGRYSSIEQRRYDQFQASGQIAAEQINYRSSGNPPLSIAQGLLTFRPERVGLMLQARSGASDFAANGAVENLLGYLMRSDLLKGSLQLSSQLIDLNEFMTGTATATHPVDTTKMEVIPVPANVDFTVQLFAARILYEYMELRQVNGMLAVRDGALELQRLAFNTLGGSVQMSGSYSTRQPEEPAFSYSLKLENLDLVQTVNAVDAAARLAPIARHASGRFSSDLAVSGRLDQRMQPVLMSLSGSGTLASRQITVANFQPLQQLADALKMTQYRQLVVPDVRLSFRFENGRVHVSPFETSWNGARSIISGTHGFDQSLDYQVQLRIPRSQLPAAAVQVFSEGMAKLQQTLGTSPQLPDPVQVLVKIGGTVSKPVINTDFRQQASQMVETLTQAAEQQVEKKLEEVKADARAEADRLLQQAQQQAQIIRQQAQQAADKLKKEGYAQADKLVAEAKNPIAKAAAQEAAKKLKQETDKKAQAIIDAADKEAQKVLNEAQRKANELLK